MKAKKCESNISYEKIFGKNLVMSKIFYNFVEIYFYQMAKLDFIEEIKDDMYLYKGQWYSEFGLSHMLLEACINEENMLLEYYDQMSKPYDLELLDGYTVWFYGLDRENNPPHVHLIKGNPGKKDSINIEIHLLDLEAYWMETPKKQAITWDNLPKKLKDGFFTWLLQIDEDPKYQVPNIITLLRGWDAKNPDNRIEKWIDKDKTLHPLIHEFLYGKPIEIDKLIKSIFEIVLPLYQANKEQREQLHHINDPIEFARKVGLPFDFNDFNITPKIKNVIADYEKMCYGMTR